MARSIVTIDARNVNAQNSRPFFWLVSQGRWSVHQKKDARRVQDAAISFIFIARGEVRAPSRSSFSGDFEQFGKTAHFG